MNHLPDFLRRGFAAGLIALSLTAACGPTTRRPGGGAVPPSTPTPGPTTTPGTTNPGSAGTAGTPGVGTPEARAMAEEARVAAQSVSGVGRAHVVYLGNVALVGIEPANTTGMQPGSNGALEKQVGDAVRAKVPGITQVYVTTKPDLVGSLQRISQGVTAGQPLTSFTAEISRLLAQLAPASSPGAPATTPAPAAPGR